MKRIQYCFEKYLFVTSSWEWLYHHFISQIWNIIDPYLFNGKSIQNWIFIVMLAYITSNVFYCEKIIFSVSNYFVNKSNCSFFQIRCNSLVSNPPLPSCVFIRSQISNLRYSEGILDVVFTTYWRGKGTPFERYKNLVVYMWIVSGTKSGPFWLLTT